MLASLAIDWLCVLGQISVPLWAEGRGEIGGSTVAKSGPTACFCKESLLQHCHALLFTDFLRLLSRPKSSAEQLLLLSNLSQNVCVPAPGQGVSAACPGSSWALGHGRHRIDTLGVKAV